MQALGFEVGVHGLDAWCDVNDSIAEKDRILNLLGKNEKVGIRIHWLYFDENSYAIIEKSGYYYDSTCGYNSAVGFKAGTTQVFRPLQARSLMELPLHIQDTALFYSRRMHLSAEEAMQSCERLMHLLKEYGGVLTVLWHMRSIVPDRLWDDYYTQLLDKLQNNRVWIDKAIAIVEWFKKRRTLLFHRPLFMNNMLQYHISYTHDDNTPDLKLRLYKFSAGKPGVPEMLKYEELDATGLVNINLNTRIVN
jgi:hypothetical protein